MDNVSLPEAPTPPPDRRTLLHSKVVRMIWHPVVRALHFISMVQVGRSLRPKSFCAASRSCGGSQTRDIRATRGMVGLGGIVGHPPLPSVTVCLKINELMSVKHVMS